MYRFRCGALHRWATFLLLGLADRITVQMKSYALGYPRHLRGRIVTIPNPVPVASRGAKPDVADTFGRFTVLVVSRLDPVQKNIGCLVGAFARIAERFPTWDLRIVGDGPEHAQMLPRIDAYGLADRIRIEASTPDVFDAYSRSHLFAIPSRWEGFSNALAEAMSHGLPAVGFDQAAGVAELIGEGGWLAEGLDDEAALATALARAMADDKERLRRGRVAAQRMCRFAPEQQFDLWADLLGSLVTRGTQ
jgi:glycosyltransferase involved in cell wall biosynthesis